MTEKERQEMLSSYERWFALNGHTTGYDVSAIGFHNWLKEHHPELIKNDTNE